MKCKNCDCCHKITYKRYNPRAMDFQDEELYECWGVKEPFEIPNINHECYEYPEKREQDPLPMFKDDGFLIGTESCGILITNNNMFFVKNNKKISLEDIINHIDKDKSK